ncbi:MAG: ribosome small subunit-dependent GTPase A [Gammaproteobacteria bacterium]|nr:ribosome small subunit-dependent GTPase A [Gammaproteobacteria bacterium]
MTTPRSGRGIVLAAYGRGALVLAGEEAMHCGLVGRKLRLVCGDAVGWHAGTDSAVPLIDAVEPRRNCVERIDARGRAEPVVANIDRVAIVVAPEPRPDWFLVDRYWAGALQAGVGAMLIVNKSDLGTAPIADEIGTYAGLGLRCIEICCRSGRGLPDLRSALGASVTLLVGQSGVGKSTLVNALVPLAAAQTAELGRDQAGRHTTTTARRYRSGDGAALVDAPGVRDFAPPALFARAATHAFIEVLAHGTACRFNDCRHFDEPGCAVRAAVDARVISPRRYESYRRLARLYENLAP